MKPFGNPIAFNNIRVGKYYQILSEDSDLLKGENGYVLNITNDGIFVGFKDKPNKHFIRYDNLISIKPLSIKYNKKYFIHLGDPYNIIFEGVIKPVDNFSDEHYFLFKKTAIINDFNYEFKHKFDKITIIGSLNNVLNIMKPLANNLDSRLMLPMMMSNNRSTNAAAYELIANSSDMNKYIGGQQRNKTLKNPTHL